MISWRVLRMNVKAMSLGELGTNCYLVYADNQALIIDPGGEPEKVIDFLHKKELEPQAILLTHAHFDHIGAVSSLRSHFFLDVYLHEEEGDWLERPDLNRSTAFMRQEVRTDPPEHFLKPGKMQLEAFEFEVIHTPGHSPGSVSFIFADHGFIISGDVLFQQGIGRTDLPRGNIRQLESSIRNHLYQLDESFIVYPGHGSPTSIGYEKVNNPFVPAK